MGREGEWGERVNGREGDGEWGEVMVNGEGW